MPTGYTANLCNGEQSLEDFVKAAVRGMGVFFNMRDDGVNSPLTFDEDSSYDSEEYWVNQVKEREAELDNWNATSDSDRLQVFFDARQRVIKRNRESIDRHRPILARLENMKGALLSIEYDPLLVSFRDFMVDQLEQTIRFDGEAYVSEVPTDFQEWVDGQSEMYERLVERANDSLAEKKEQIAERNKYREAYKKFLNGLGIEVR